MDHQSEHRIPTPDELPDAPEVFSVVSDEDASLPSAPQVAPLDEVDVAAIDLHAVSDKLPTITDLPITWALILDDPLRAELDIQSTLPLLWERALGHEVERVVAVSPIGLMSCSNVTHAGHTVHAMPQATAENFVKWLGAQVFIRRSRKQYVECMIHTTTLQVQNAQYNAFIAIPSTTRYHMMTTLGNPPLVVTASNPRGEVKQRARAAMSDPSGLLTPIELRE